MVGKTAVHDDHLGRDVDEGGGDGNGVNRGDDHDDDFEESDHGDVGKTALHDNHLGFPVLQLAHDPGLQEESSYSSKLKKVSCSLLAIVTIITIVLTSGLETSSS